MNNIERRVRDFLIMHGIDVQASVIVAFSGGIDSAVLLHAMARAGFSNLRAVHVRHNLRPSEELDAEKELVISTCRNLKVSLTIVNVKEGAIEQYAQRRKCGIEAAARAYRYHALLRTARRYSACFIVTAHHAEDQRETLLFNLLRGGTIHALTGIEPAGRLFKDSGILVLRPLLECEKEELRAYAAREKLTWSEDSSNRDTGFSRNRIRHELVPLLDRRFPSWKPALHAFIQEARSLEELLNTIVSEQSKEAIRGTGAGTSLDLHALMQMPYSVRREVLSMFLKSAGVPEQRVGKTARELLHAVQKGRTVKQAGGFAFEHVEGVLRCKGKASGSSDPEWRMMHAQRRAWRDSPGFVLVDQKGSYRFGALALTVDFLEQGPDEAASAESAGISAHFCSYIPFVLRDRKPGDAILAEKGEIRIEKCLKKRRKSGSGRQILIAEDMQGISAVLIVNEALNEIEVMVRRPGGSCAKDQKFVMLSVKGVLPTDVRSEQ